MRKGIRIVYIIVLVIVLIFVIWKNFDKNDFTLPSTSEINEDGVKNNEIIDEMKDTYTEDELWEELKYSSVQIQGENIYGSGSIYKIDEETIYIVSNDHLTVYVMDPVVYFYDGSSANGISTINAEQLDMGILEVKKEDLTTETLLMLKEIQVQKEEILIEEGMNVYAHGSADGIGTSRVIGTVVNKWEYHPEFHSHMIRCSGVVLSGMSGAGVFNLEGNYLGMVSGAKEEEFVFLPFEIMKEEEYLGGNLND